MKKILLNVLKSMSALSLSLSVLSANTTSMWYIHQPQEPKELSKLKR